MLYPPCLATARRLDHYAQRFSTVELDASYYRWPSDSAFASWRQRLPNGFLLSVKAPRGLTHIRRLHEPDTWLARIAKGLKCLGERRGVLLVQLPPTLSYDHDRLKYALRCVPRHRRICVEFRHPSWHQEHTFNVLEEHGAAYCVVSGANLPCVLRVTAAFVYARLHGLDHRHLYGLNKESGRRAYRPCACPHVLCLSRGSAPRKPESKNLGTGHGGRGLQASTLIEAMQQEPDSGGTQVASTGITRLTQDCCTIAGLDSAVSVVIALRRILHSVSSWR